MAQTRILLVAATWTDMAAYIATTADGNHLILRAVDGSDYEVAIKASTAPGVAGQAMVQNEAVEVIMGANAAEKLWVKSTAGGYLEIDDIGGPTVIVAPSVAVA